MTVFGWVGVGLAAWLALGWLVVMFFHAAIGGRRDDD
jgi:hypothetical protein